MRLRQMCNTPGKTFEQQTAKQQYKMEQSYLKLYASHPKEAQRLLQNFEDKTMQNAQTLAVA
ncbi:peptidase family C69 [Salmonella enterica subsp. enterica serovar Sanjuan]|uniref:Peptidase family C69 n=1 Tax=Salmonella enterica subsp. enterica serovar Sanjuan TaxID=1160765 RepID=A0A447NX38_SALET|nr:peptidase family C69 [Salmonella enterica subsp. enterica serovar Sanjuan]